MKRILFVLPYYKIGGTLTSFVNLIPLIDTTQYCIDAYALTNTVDDFSILPTSVNYIGLKNTGKDLKKSQCRVKSFLLHIFKTFKKMSIFLGYDPADVVFRKMALKLSDKYDIVIAFQEGQASRMAQYISAPYKIAWIHCMYSRFKTSNNACYINVYNNFDKIVCVSNTAAKEMQDFEPQWNDKICVVYNAINLDLVSKQALSHVHFDKKINIVSVGRIDPVKGFSAIPSIAKRLQQSGLEFDWWIIGGVAVPNEYKKIVDNIKDNEVSNCVHLTGPLSNPYPYIKSSNLLVCLSSSETFNYTIAEAKVLGTPVITTDFSCAFEFVENEKSGLILPIDKISEGIIRILGDNQLYNNIQSYLLSNCRNKNLTVEQFETLLNI